MIKLKEYISEGIFDVMDSDLGELPIQAIKSELQELYSKKPTDFKITPSGQVSFKYITNFGIDWQDAIYKYVMSGYKISKIRKIETLKLSSTNQPISSINKYPLHISSIDTLMIDYGCSDFSDTNITIGSINNLYIITKDTDNIGIIYKRVKATGAKIKNISIRPAGMFVNINNKQPIKGLKTKGYISIHSNFLQDVVYDKNEYNPQSKSSPNVVNMRKYINEFTKNNSCSDIYIYIPDFNAPGGGYNYLVEIKNGVYQKLKRQYD